MQERSGTLINKKMLNAFTSDKRGTFASKKYIVKPHQLSKPKLLSHTLRVDCLKELPYVCPINQQKPRKLVSKLKPAIRPCCSSDSETEVESADEDVEPPPPPVQQINLEQNVPPPPEDLVQQWLDWGYNVLQIEAIWNYDHRLRQARPHRAAPRGRRGWS